MNCCKFPKYMFKTNKTLYKQFYAHCENTQIFTFETKAKKNKVVHCTYLLKFVCNKYKIQLPTISL